MKSFARYISLVAIVAITAITLTSCSKKEVAEFFGPQSEFYGIEKNITQWLLFAKQPSDISIEHRMDPNGYFNDTLIGSRVYWIESHFEDGTVFGAFDLRINNVPDDAYINEVYVDWYVIWGGGVVACVTPVGGGDASNYPAPIEIENYVTQVGKTKSTLNMTPPAPMTVTMITPTEMKAVKTAFADSSRATRIDQINLVNQIRHNHNLKPMEEK